MTRLEGGCLCGAIRYLIEEEPLAAGACFCRDCQYVAGGSPAHVLILPATALVITKGAPQAFAVLSDAGRKVSRFFCGACGTHLFRRGSARPEITTVAAGSLDNPEVYRPRAQTWTRSARSWHSIDPRLPRFTCEPPDTYGRVA
jgi:hypothetical protein